MILQRDVENVGYSILAAVDKKNKPMADCETGETNDTLALVKVAQSTIVLLSVETMNVLADKGHPTGDQINKCTAQNIVT